ncbi:lycopene cyclase domain-containing protein [uncultured Brachybacterium sp.]|uniref:lycopene cyclase domain-containing protein n=1 Tax=uncultured Brachybacterium sp. TaxID=189680 RepID=UPI00261E5999|nr:lycopene cyclase domain-containing protein [uncultured Brachybacterium sp.]
MSYAALAGLFLIGPVLTTALALMLRRPSRRWWLLTGGTIAVLLVMTVLFDSLMIAVDLFRFEESLLLGWRIGLAPVEDLAWPLAAGLLLPSLWLLLTPERER